MANLFRIAVVEDDTSLASFLRLILRERGYEVEIYFDPEKALKEITYFKPHLVLTDLKMPKMDGIAFMEKAKKLCPEADFVVITAFGSIPSAVEAIKKGAVDYITKPFSSPQEFLDLIENLLRKKAPKPESTEELPPLEILFAGMEALYEKVLKVAPTDTTVMLYGETGVGKTALAKAIHFLSQRKGSFVEINCASLPETLMEAELFGYEKGAFTGAVKSKPGKIELAQDGTLFLDEIAEMSLSMQAKFLKVLQDRTFERLGSLTPIKIRVRFITATNKNLKELLSQGKFREDLYFRINVFPLYIPPLRERKEALLKIAEFLIERIAKKLGSEKKFLSKSAKNLLLSYPWPGNIRELENVLERSFILSEEEEIELFLEESYRKKDLQEEGAKPLDLKSLEREAILEALKKAKGNKRKASEILGLPLRTLYHKLKEYGL
ncbi:MAG: sigma-54 dependent transcriptional regulator [Thermodesulfobacterium sp.]|nr:sigma-54 dependent transcriptional regulator [Thermodesulfobacterium sp.]